MHFFFFFGLTLSDFETGRSKGSALLRYDNKQSAQVTSLVAVIQKKKDNSHFYAERYHCNARRSFAWVSCSALCWGTL
jgi:hypothetical protein